MEIIRHIPFYVLFIYMEREREREREREKEIPSIQAKERDLDAPPSP